MPRKQGSLSRIDVRYRISHSNRKPMDHHKESRSTDCTATTMNIIVGTPYFLTIFIGNDFPNNGLNLLAVKLILYFRASTNPLVSLLTFCRINSLSCLSFKAGVGASFSSISTKSFVKINAPLISGTSLSFSNFLARCLLIESISPTISSSGRPSPPDRKWTSIPA